MEGIEKNPAKAYSTISQLPSEAGRKNILEKNIENLKIGHINARSVGKNAHNIEALILNDKIHILSISETWLKSEISATLDDLVPQGYKILMRNRPGRKNGGGVAIIHKELIHCKKIGWSITVLF